MDLLSRLLSLMPVTGALDVRCHYGEAPTMLCGRFLMPAVPQQLLRGNLPGLMLVSCLDSSCPDRGAAEAVAGSRLARLIRLMQEEAAEHGPGSEAMMNHLSGALFGLTLRYQRRRNPAARPAGAGRSTIRCASRRAGRSPCSCC